MFRMVTLAVWFVLSLAASDRLDGSKVGELGETMDKPNCPLYEIVQSSLGKTGALRVFEWGFEWSHPAGRLMDLLSMRR